MSEQIEVGQVWNDRDKRMLSGNRCGKVAHLATPEHPKVLLEPCRVDGSTYGGKPFSISPAGLRARWRLLVATP